MTVEKVQKEDDVEIFINREPTEYNCSGSGSCVTCDFFTEYNGFNINYSPPNEGCYSRHYFPSSHQGTIFISKYDGNEDDLDSFDFYNSLIAGAIEKNYCQLKK